MTSFAHDATLTLMPDHWLIHYTEQSGVMQYARWELARIAADPNFTSTLFIFRYTDFHLQTIECKEEDLPELLRGKYPSVVFFKKQGLGRFWGSNAFFVILLITILGSLACFYWYGLPYFSQKIASRIPQDFETKIGDSLYERVIAGYKVDEKLTSGVNDFAKSIDFKTTYPVKVTVVKEDQANAFALPGGHIVVFDKILEGMRTKEELAALLAHEVAHVHYRHSLKSVSRSLGSYLFISLILGDVSGIVAVLAENSNMLINLTYSRELETEADRKAMETLESNGISLKGFVDLFKLLESHGGDSGSVEMLSSHPLTGERIANAKARAREQTNIGDQSALQQKWLKLGVK
ncbi:M48 family metallopeptidase [Dyadobacter sp. CY323]|uniref:M48 family metallopeptidase n=1 Tax=Dyadobacter sp. CY323 TaxID=2907302 RepID=UPI001F2DE3F6|nr:M48 family metallopeptidase [Dyadobacter sp. CY323]MCE6988257.1 M48 family metallopeptidase [Dyadobacter sp. CY323]